MVTFSYRGPVSWKSFSALDTWSLSGWTSGNCPTQSSKLAGWFLGVVSPAAKAASFWQVFKCLFQKQGLESYPQNDILKKWKSDVNWSQSEGGWWWSRYINHWLLVNSPEEMKKKSYPQLRWTFRWWLQPRSVSWDDTRLTRLDTSRPTMVNMKSIWMKPPPKSQHPSNKA